MVSLKEKLEQQWRSRGCVVPQHIARWSEAHQGTFTDRVTIVSTSAGTARVELVPGLYVGKGRAASRYARGVSLSLTEINHRNKFARFNWLT